jgi:hypothetical protein
MGRPKNERQGKQITIYLTPERLDKLGSDPRKSIYRIIDETDVNDIVHAPEPGVSFAEPTPVSRTQTTNVVYWKCKCGRKVFTAACTCGEQKPCE